jgi:DNA-binding transcriptional ArsR family regulator
MPIAIRMNEKTFSKYFKAFGDPSRLKILQLLSSKEMTVGEIVRAVGLSQPTVSRHLAILREAEIVTDRREGQRVYYSLDKRAVETCCDGFCNCLAIRLQGAKKRKKK